MSCHWHNFHTTEFAIFISYLYNVWTQAMNTINTTTCHHGYRNSKLIQLDDDDGTYTLWYFQCTYIL